MYILLSTIDNKPEVLFSSENLEILKERMGNEAITYVTDNVGKNNWINTLEKEVEEFQVYPNYKLKRESEMEINVYKVCKENQIIQGWIFNKTKSIINEKYIGNFKILPVKNDEKKPTLAVDNYTKSQSKKEILFQKNFNKVLLDLMSNSLIKRRNSIDPLD
jgi:hypothetical protein